MSATGPKSLRAPEGHEQFLTVLAEHIDAGAVIPCTGPGWADWTVEDGPPVIRAADRCLDCPALVSCQGYAVAGQEPAGVWGGTTPKERARVGRAAEQGAAA